MNEQLTGEEGNRLCGWMGYQDVALAVGKNILDLEYRPFTPWPEAAEGDSPVPGGDFPVLAVRHRTCVAVGDGDVSRRRWSFVLGSAMRSSI